MAELEADAGAAATYFLMTRSEFYNLDAPSGAAAIERLRGLGHRVGLHAVWPHVDHDERFDPVLAWHNPDPEYMREPVEGFVNVMQAPWADVYRSDSNQHWRQGCPHEELACRCVRAPPAPDTPGDLGVPGRFHARDDARDAVGRAGAPSRATGGRQDRPDVRPLTVLLTACGSPGTAALVRALRENGERAVRLVGVDMSEAVIGRHLVDGFHQVPPGSDPGFADAVRRICRDERVDAVLPQSSFDLPGLAEAQERFEGIAVLVASPDAIRRSNDKAETYALLDHIGVRGPAWRRVRGAEAAAAAARDLGYPDADVCMKPVYSSGSRGFRILSASADRHEQLLANRPGVAEALRLEDLVELLGDDETELLVMELATGKERTVDGIAVEGRIALGHPKTREAMRAGLAMYFETLDDPRLMATAQEIVAELRLDHFFNIQLVGEHVIEINPRISTIVYQEDLNLPYLGIKHALGEISEPELQALAARVRPTRRALRFFDQVEWDEA